MTSNTCRSRYSYISPDKRGMHKNFLIVVSFNKSEMNYSLYRLNGVDNIWTNKLKVFNFLGIGEVNKVITQSSFSPK